MSHVTRAPHFQGQKVKSQLAWAGHIAAASRTASLIAANEVRLRRVSTAIEATEAAASVVFHSSCLSKLQE